MPSPLHPTHAHLEHLLATADLRAHLAHDPLQFVHRYHRAEDREIAALLASGFAFGRVDLFLPVLTSLFRHLDRHGGPAAFVARLDARLAAPLTGLVYRWIRGPDVVGVLAGLRRATDGAPLESLFAGDAPLRDRLATALDRLRAATSREVPLTRGALAFLPDPRAGSACKRWNLMLRWLVRPDDGVDLGVWTALRPAELILPVDVHTGRLSRLLGLTDRADASWRTAEAITERLRAWDPVDPVRFDFALAHLGISGACRARYDAAICPTCPLAGVCREPARARGAAATSSRRP